MEQQRVVVVAFNEYGKRIGETHHNARISDATVDRIRELHEDFGWGYVAICRELKVSLTAVRKICTYERRAQTPVKWKRIKVNPDKPQTEEKPNVIATVNKLEKKFNYILVPYRKAYLPRILPRKLGDLTTMFGGNRGGRKNRSS